MNELKIERTFESDPETVFAFVTETEKLLQWWGPEGMSVSDHQLDLSAPGNWMATFVGAEGNSYKVSGEVVQVDPPNSVEFTWGWHDENDDRGHSSNIRFDVKPAKSGGAEFVLTQTGLEDDSSIANHNQGWTSSITKLERVLK